MKNKASEFLGVDVEETQPKEEIIEKIKETDSQSVETKIPELDDMLYIENLNKIIEIVEKENEEKKLNPSSVMDGETGVNFINGEPHLVIDNEYVPHDKAQIVLQTRKVVREYLKLQNLIKGIKE